jgi:hypothetical protein
MYLKELKSACIIVRNHIFCVSDKWILCCFAQGGKHYQNNICREKGFVRVRGFLYRDDVLLHCLRNEYQQNKRLFFRGDDEAQQELPIK